MSNFNEEIGETDKKMDDHSFQDGSTGKGYECPMKCEGDKTYETTGTCPVCNMPLTPII